MWRFIPCQERVPGGCCFTDEYIIIFDVRDDVVNVVGIFHQLENYPSKL